VGVSNCRILLITFTYSSSSLRFSSRRAGLAVGSSRKAAAGTILMKSWRMASRLWKDSDASSCSLSLWICVSNSLVCASFFSMSFLISSL
jgi:hypothetical protein